MHNSLSSIVRYLDSLLRIQEVSDSAEALNGLQVENEKPITRIAASVDACLSTINSAADIGAELLLVHHGLFWEGLKPLTGIHGKRIRRLMESGVALYSVHIPLDLNPELGNNALLASQLELEDSDFFGDYMGERLGVIGAFRGSRDDLVSKLSAVLGVEPHLLPFGPKDPARVAVISGGGGGMIGQALEAGADTLVTGEGKHHNFFDAEESGINVLFAGHYATETIGIKALAKHLSERFQLPWEFIDHPTGL